MAFPNAKIIHLKRDPIATCWSNYKHYFSSSGIGYAYDLKDLIEFYKHYDDLMAFWNAKFPAKIHELNYEKLTEQQEQQTSDLLEYCDLEWEQQCLDFHLNQRLIKTASVDQVRKKLYQGSSEVWKNYQKHLQPLIDAFE
jgi:hypothetical protein